MYAVSYKKLDNNETCHQNLCPEPKLLKSTASGRPIGKYHLWLSLHDGSSDLREILYEDAKFDDHSDCNVKNFGFSKFKMADGFKPKLYGRIDATIYY